MKRFPIRDVASSMSSPSEVAKKMLKKTSATVSCFFWGENGFGGHRDGRDQGLTEVLEKFPSHRRRSRSSISPRLDEEEEGSDEAGL